jgi:hypothetical protein
MSPVRRTSRQTLKPPAGGVAVRMYRQGLGDCFLLALATADARRPTYVLVDCGVHRAQSNGADNMRLAIADIIAATSGRLDVVIVTHEHTDHLSGFVTAAEQIAAGQLTIDRLWLAWTEDDEDALARQLRRQERSALRALGLVRRHLAARGALASDAARLNPVVQALRARLDDTLELSGGLAADRAAALTGNQQALKILREHAHRVEFLRPGSAPVDIPGAGGARAYVLGPPRDAALLKKSKPSSGSRQETYLTDSVGLTSLAAAAMALDRGEDTGPPSVDAAAQEEQCHPFSQTYRLNFDQAAGDSFFRRHYGLGDSEHTDAWRQIEHDWLFAAEQLALDLDHHTNNTSLALAFEIGPPGSGRVLLFPGDAQVGNWLSWRDLRWGPAAGGITTANLLARTALYKVGHHASHNATLKFDADGQPYGLELMPQSLIALIPVDKRIADKLPGWVMPDPELYVALKGKAGRRILRSDDLDAELAELPTRTQAVPGVPGARWRRSAATKAEEAGPLYYDVYLEPGD